MGVLRCLEDYFRQPRRSEDEKLPFYLRMREIFGEFHNLAGVGFVPSFRHPHKSPTLQSISTLLTADWEHLSQFDEGDMELEMIIELIKENDGLDVLPKFYRDLQVNNHSIVLVKLSVYYVLSFHF